MKSTHRLKAVWLALFCLVTGMAVPALASEEPVVVVEGGGWGHGIGMSQYGAYGQALEGASGEEIVGHYYSGSSTAQIVDQVGSEHFVIADPTPLWVGMLTNKSRVKFEAVGGSLTACHNGSGGCSFPVSPGENWAFVTLGDETCQLTKDGEAVSSPGECQGQVRGMTPGGAHIVLPALDAGRDEFARGKLMIRTPDQGTRLHASLQLNLEQYLYGLAEVPFSWHPEALRAQALAGRSYATWRLISRGPVADFDNDRKATCWCHMYATTADQSYSGWANEAATGASNWKSAVDSTAGKVITHPDASQANVVAAFYSSSTGGRTENNEDMWGGSAVSYLRSQPDPWSQKPEVNNPFGVWEFPFTEQALSDAYGVDSVHGLEVIDRFASGTPKTVHIYVRSDGTNQTIVTSGPGMYTTLGLRGRNVGKFDYGAISGIVGDFTGDGKADIANVTPFNQTWWVGKATSNSFKESVWLNQGANVGLAYSVSGDFNGDGFADFVGYQASSGKVLFGESTGSRFKLDTWANHAVPESWGPLLVGDFSGDGIDDLAEYDSNQERWRVYRLAAGSVVKEFWYDFSVNNPNWGSFAVGDVDGNGFDDILTTDANTGDVIALLSDGSEFSPSSWQTLPNDGDWQYVAAADFDGDDIDDLAAYDPAASTWWVVPGRAGTTGGSPKAWFTYTKPNQNFVDQVVGDFNSDGKADIVAYLAPGGRLKVLKSNGQGFSRSTWGQVGAKRFITEIHAGDVNGDGTTDVIAWDNTRRRWWVALADGNGFAVAKWGKLLR
ncbi:MAG: SpoIID/LytB domain-containing protein [Acidimicrobiia bacterium]|nr:SpoIID/LytB domain-containing protein [Acidimicrobiia bacterium]